MIAIVGAGLIGLALACELARRGAEVRVFDRAEPGRGASWAGAGMLAPFTEELHEPAFERLCTASLERYPAFVARLAELGGVDAYLDLSGILEVAFDETERLRLRGRAAALAARGIAARGLDASEAVRLEPSLSRATLGGCFVASEGAVDNRRLGRALLAAAMALGVRVDVTGTVALESDARRVRGLRTAAGFVAAETVVNACGAWAGELDGVPAEVAVPVVPVKGQMLALAVPAGLVTRTIWGAGVYGVPRRDGRLLVGATVEAAGLDVRTTAGGQHDLLAGLLRALPSLRDLAVTETWAGLRPGTPDGLPYLGASSLEGYVLATGHYRNGILLTPITADVVADVIEGRPPAVPIEAFAPSRARERDARPSAVAS